MALVEDAFTISAPRTGDAGIRKLQLDGWSNNPLLEQGRLYWQVTVGNSLQFFSDEAKGATEMVCSGPIQADDTVALVENNSSGITGSARVSHTDAEISTGEAIITYAQEQDLLLWEKRLVIDFLDDNGEFLGETRFEQPLKRAKVAIDKMLSNKLEPFFRRKASREIDLAAISKPRTVAETHALYTIYLIYWSQNNGDTDIQDLANQYKRMSKDELDLAKIAIDVDNDDLIDTRTSTQGGKMTR